eukprot:1173887-Prorocentrum_minimum.AAC.1
MLRWYNAKVVQRVAMSASSVIIGRTTAREAQHLLPNKVRSIIGSSVPNVIALGESIKENPKFDAMQQAMQYGFMLPTIGLGTLTGAA